MNLVGLGPWYVCRPLTQCMTDGRTHLAIAPSADWITPTADRPAWAGTRIAAEHLASIHGGDAVPTRWVDIRILRRDWRKQQLKTIHAIKP
jgi:cytosine/adenosine deaminase-related metal-dependent hydrolase